MAPTPRIPGETFKIFEPRARSSRARNLIGVITLALLLSAGLLRWHKIDQRDIWIDEANGVLMAQGTFSEFIERLKLDSSPPLYYVTLKTWIAAFGDGEAALRALSLAGGLALVASVLVLGRRWFSLEVGILAALLVALSPIQIFYSQQARMYAWLPVGALWALHWQGRALLENKIRYLIAAAACTLAMFYTHNHGLYLLPAQAILALASGRLKRHPARWCGYGAAVAIGYLPWTPVLLEQLRNSVHYSWFLPFWNEYGPLGALWATVRSFAPGGEQPLYVALGGVKTLAPFSTALIAGLFLLGGAAAFLFAPRGHRETPPDGDTGAGGSTPATASTSILNGSGNCSADTASGRCKVGALYLAAVAPLASALSVSMISTPNYVPGRCDQLVFGLFSLCVAIGLQVVRPWILRYLLAAALLIFSVAGLRPLYDRPVVTSERALARDLAGRVQDGDAVLCTAMTRAPLEYYRRRYRIPIVLYSYPPDTAAHLGNIDETALLRDPDGLRRAVRETVRTIRAKHGSDARFFLLMEYLKGDRIRDNPVNRILYDELLRGGLARPLEIVGQYSQAGTGLPVVVMQLQLK